jgi:hypothetical protein
LYQRYLQLINILLINCKTRWPNKAETKNRTFFEHAHNLDYDFPRMRMTLHGYGISKVIDPNYFKDVLNNFALDIF